MRYASVCSGIEAATVAWHPLGWEPVFFSEIEKFPCAVLAHHYPHTPNLGDMTRFKEWPDADFDVLVGGTPCQSFSVAGLRKGLDDPRGNLMLTYLAIARRYRPKWLVWENVPGVLSSLSHDAPDPCPPPPPVDLGCDGAEVETDDEYISEELHAFNCLLAGFSELGYGFAYRVLDAQYVRVDGLERAVPQRRRRVFVVGHLGDWRRAAAVLFERESLQGNNPPRREAGKGLAPTIAARTRGGGGLGTDFDCDGGLIADVAPTLNAHFGEKQGLEDQHINGGAGLFVTTPIFASDGQAAKDAHQNAGGQVAVAFDMRGREGGSQFEGPHETANIRAASGGSSKSYVAEQWAVRRLTPLECARLQGFPDDYLTSVRIKGKPPADGPMYKALGNSFAVNVVRWIGQRIDMVGAIPSSSEAA